MLFHLSWTRRDSVGEDGDDRILKILDSFEPPANQTIHMWVERADGGGGFGLVETDDVATLAAGPPIFAPFYRFELHPVVQHDESIELLKEAVAARS